MRSKIIRYIVAIYMGTNIIYAFPAIANESKEIEIENARSEIWNDKCAKCHELDGTPTKIGTKLKAPQNIFDSVKQKTILEIEDVIKNGQKKMPAYKHKLTNEEISFISRYIKITYIIQTFKERINKELNKRSGVIVL